MKCVPCSERGRSTAATRTVGEEPWCEKCFSGEGTDAEMIGASVVPMDERIVNRKHLAQLFRVPEWLVDGEGK